MKSPERIFGKLAPVTPEIVGRDHARAGVAVVLIAALLVAATSALAAQPVPPAPVPPSAPAYPPPPAREPPPPPPPAYSYVGPPVVVVPPPPPPPPPLSPAVRALYAPFYAAGLVLRYGLYYGIVAPLDVFGRALSHGVKGGSD